MVKRHDDNAFGIVAIIFSAITILGSWALDSTGKGDVFAWSVIWVILGIFTVFGLMMGLIGIILDNSSIIGILGFGLEIVAVILLFYISL
ncbi:MAG TPA: hypothetical protein VKM55_13085 [Candidatus Lokiarchaeia archaeon]|nr:hypothetical protein [Candidatus Lokiarchaeia archaeon]